ncbi:hypothetical protein FQN54_005852 [Arachnomyces sp. PD_36]|nr:hypothetical protein FQN54_005852 [Arachnomyces sp. PD_36]
MGSNRASYQQLNLLNPDDIELVETSSSLSRLGEDTSSSTNLVQKADRSEADISAGHKHWWELSGWRVGAVFAASGVFFALLTNTAIAIAIPAIYGLENDISTIYTGSCDQTGRMNTIIHLGINLLSTLLLSASNYCMQCLSAPTRANIEKSHRNGKWLDIGAPSIRNIQAIGATKTTLWMILGLSSIPLHLLYNSVFFSAISTNTYTIVWVTEGFSEGAPFNTTEFDVERNEFWELQEKAPLFDNLTNEECIGAYAKDFVSARRDVLLVVDTQDMLVAGTYGSVFERTYYEMEGGRSRVFGSLDTPYFWICEENSNECPKMVPSILSEIANGGVWECNSGDMQNPEPEYYPTYRIKYCLSEPAQESCTLHFSLSLIIVVIVCNAGKLMAMIAIILWLHSSRPLMTIGDAIDTFMTRNDPFIKGRCLASWETFRETVQDSIPSKPQEKKCGQAVSARHWRFVLSLFFVVLAAIVALLAYGIAEVRGPSDAKTLWDLGFGAVRANSLIAALVSWGRSGLMRSVLLANIPQPILSFLYLLFNSLCTRMLLAKEWGSYQLERKPLRVSEPRGQQRSSYFLQVPYRYAVPLLAMSSALHWGVSQSLFLARINVLRAGRETEALTTCGYSPAAIIFTLIMISLLLLGGIALRYKKIDSDMPIASSCSAAIAAACETSILAKEDNDPTMPVQWGVVNFESAPDGKRHCCFTAGQVTGPVG